jgi:mono/diheme cytochrome c family protein
MFTRSGLFGFGALGAALALAFSFAGASADSVSGFGQAATPAQIQAWNLDVPPSGDDLPPGGGTVAEGATAYAAKCAACHGALGQGGPMDRLVGGQGTLDSAKPVKTIGSYWPYATSVFDYIRRAMPFANPGTLSNAEVYGLTAYLLNLNGIVPKDARLDARSLPRIKMPNHDNFILTDPRPDAP